MAGLLHDLLMAIAVAGRTCAGLAFVLAATQKSMHWRILPGVISNYRILPRWMNWPVSALLPPVEMLVGMGLLSALSYLAAVPIARRIGHRHAVDQGLLGLAAAKAEAS